MKRRPSPSYVSQAIPFWRYNRSWHCLTGLCILLLVTCCVDANGEHEAVKWTVRWEEIRDDPGKENEVSTKENLHRPFFSTKTFEQYVKQKNSSARPVSRAPHPLRMDTYVVNVRWRKRPKSTRVEKLVLQYDNETGFARFKELPKSPIGDWDLSSGGLWFRLPFNDSTLVFASDFILNPFGEAPRLLRGVVLQEEPQRWWGGWKVRKVVGTFTGNGIGQDTLDLSYFGRKRSLS